MPMAKPCLLYAREEAAAAVAKVLTSDEARRSLQTSRTRLACEGLAPPSLVSAPPAGQLVLKSCIVPKQVPSQHANRHVYEQVPRKSQLEHLDNFAFDCQCKAEKYMEVVPALRASPYLHESCRSCLSHHSPHPMPGQW